MKQISLNYNIFICVGNVILDKLFVKLGICHLHTDGVILFILIRVSKRLLAEYLNNKSEALMSSMRNLGYQWRAQPFGD